jgi:Domain of unknown function (DUF4123)
MNTSANYVVLDRARVLGKFEEGFNLNNSGLSLFYEKGEKIFSNAGPYLFKYDISTEFAKWLYEAGWGNFWGIFIATPLNFDNLLRHCRRFLKVKTEDKEQLFFRFYDPRVLKIFLPTCERDQIQEFFGEIDNFFVEGINRGEVNRYSHQDGVLQEKKMATEMFFNEILSSSITRIEISS